jgi:Mn-dependent DtxR family transcriptional regulator
MRQEDKPFGYWLRYVDRLIEGCFEAALRDDGLSRRHWQLLNLLRAHPAHPAEIAESMWPFWSDKDVEPEDILRGLTRRGWAERDRDGRFQLTLQGEAARVEMSEKVRLVRGALTEGITTDEYEMVVDILRRMADNLAETRVSP